MSYLLNNEQKRNEIVFANRNKAYGAYVLRSTYGINLFRSLSIVMFGASAMAFTAYLFFQKPGNSPNAAGQVIIHDSVFVIPFDAQKEEKKDVGEEKHTPPKKQEDIKPEENQGKPLVSDSVAVDNSLALSSSVANTSTSAIGSETGTAISVAGSGTGTNSGMPTGNEVAQPFAVDTPPEFEGGLPALYSFIRTNLRYPAQAADAGADGTVFVKFVVDERGQVGRLSLLNSKGYGLDEEALRVVGMIPNFKTPAKANGRAVKVYYQLPIRFKISR